MSEINNPYFVIEAYKKGYFPMARHKFGKIDWHSPDPRAIIPLQDLKVPKSIVKKTRNNFFTFTANERFEEVIIRCSERTNTWISNEIIETYIELNKMGFANSVETWNDGKLVGGLYGVTIGAAFFGESMFNDISDASKAAFYKLIDIMNKLDYLLLDSQYINPFTQQLGAIEIPKNLYLELLKNAISLHREFY